MKIFFEVPLAHSHMVQGGRSFAVPEFENLYLFWDGVAWGHKEELPRRLKEGTKDFMDMVADNIGMPHFGHMWYILEQRDVYRAGPTDDKPFLIVVARDTRPFYDS